jgi:predicted PurR-regulated permease PerM
MQMLSLDPVVARSARTRATVYVGVALLLCVTYLIRRTLLVFAIAFMFAYLLYPLMDAIDRRLPRKWHMVAVGAPFLLLLSFLTGMGLILKAPVRDQTERLVAQVKSPGFKDRLENWSPLDIPVGELITEYHAQLLGMIPQLGRGLRVAERDLLNIHHSRPKLFHSEGRATHPRSIAYESS